MDSDLPLIAPAKQTIICNVPQTVFEVLKDVSNHIRWLPLQIPYENQEELANKLVEADIHDHQLLELFVVVVKNKSGEALMLNDIQPILGMQHSLSVTISGPKNNYNPISSQDYLFCTRCPGFITNHQWLGLQGQCARCKKNRNLINAEYVDYHNKKHIHLRYSRSFR